MLKYVRLKIGEPFMNKKKKIVISIILVLLLIMVCFFMKKAKDLNTINEVISSALCNVSDKKYEEYISKENINKIIKCPTAECGRY